MTNKVFNCCTQKGTAYVQICKIFAFKLTNDRIKAIQSKNVLKQLTNGRMDGRRRSTGCAQSGTRISGRGEEHHSVLVDSFINNISYSTVNITFCSVVNGAIEWLIKLINNWSINNKKTFFIQHKSSFYTQFRNYNSNKKNLHKYFNRNQHKIYILYKYNR